MRIECVAFDLDGTLIDSLSGLAAAVNAMRTDCGLPEADELSVAQWIGRGTRVLVSRALHDGLGRDAESGELDRAHTMFVEAYGGTCESGSTLRPGAQELLSRLASLGVPCAITTNKMESFSVQIARRLGVLPFLRAVIGGDTGERKPSPWMLHEAARRCGVDPQRGLLIGDSMIDVETAHAASWPVWLVDGGYGTPGSGVMLPPGSRRFNGLLELAHDLLPHVGAGAVTLPK